MMMMIIIIIITEQFSELVAQTVKNLPAMQETQVRSLGWEDPPEKAVAPHSKYSCLENPMDRGAWWAAVLGVTKSRTRLSDFTVRRVLNQGSLDKL